MRRLVAAGVTLALVFVADLAAQGTSSYVNFESPQVKPIAIARVRGHDYLLACNTPDSSVEIRDTIGMRLVERIPVGQEPVSVVWNPVLSRFYTANMLDDSISIVRLSAPSSAGPLSAKLERTQWVGDEPMMIAFLPDNLSLFVTHHSKSAMSWRHSLTLAPVIPGFSESIDLTDNFLRPGQALKEPRAIVMNGTRIFTRGHRGGHSFAHDFDLWSFDLATMRVTALGGLGSWKANMAFAKNGDLFVVASDAQNRIRGRANVAKAPTGFVKSLLHKITGAGTRTAKVFSRDLNTDNAGKPVAKQKALAHPMDVAIYERKNGAKVFIAAMHSDRLGIVDASNKDPAKWKIRVLDIPRTKGSISTMAGPRGLALKSAIKGLGGDPGDRLYVLNRLDNSIAVVDPATERVLQVLAMNNDPTPEHVKRGRGFFYSAKLSGHGFVSCASCHIDARTDGLNWDLSDAVTSKTGKIPKEVIDGVTDGRILSMVKFPPAKGRMMTQSMQGLVNHEVEGAMQRFFSNAPYHWRCDTDFAGFNGAYVALMGLPNKAAANELAGRSCVQCHFLPEGSNNRITRLGISTPQPTETAALRGLSQKEIRLEKGALSQSSIVTGETGLEHQGTFRSINDYNLSVFGHDFLGKEKRKLDDITRFTREFDTGVAPLVGFPLTVDHVVATAPGTGFALAFMERQAALANIGLAVQANLAGKKRGFFYRPEPGLYLEEPGAVTVSRSALLALVKTADDLLVFQATPLGSARRIASPTGLVSKRSGLPPSSIELLPMRAATPWRNVVKLTKNWIPGPFSNPLSFAWTGVFSGTSRPVPEPASLRSIRLLQYGILQDGKALGLSALRHEAPRRFRVAGRNIRPGAKLVLIVPNDPTTPPPYTSRRPVLIFVLPIFASGERTASGIPIYETVVEADPALAYTLVLGGPSAKGVKQAANNTLSEPPPKGSFDPSKWNKHWVWIVNEDGTFASGGWQPLRL